MEQETSHTRYDEFAERFTSLMYRHWSDILLIINHQSPRIASLLRLATPTNLKRMNGIWHIQVIAKPATQHDKLSHPRDNEIVAQAIRTWARAAAQLNLPRVKVDFEL